MGKNIDRSSAGKRRARKAVEVVSCPSAFPDFGVFGGGGGGKRRRRSAEGSVPDRGVGRSAAASAVGGQRTSDLDFDETVREIHALGSTAFTGKQAKQHARDQYREMTGRDKKDHKVPLKIVRGIKKKAAEREARAAREVRESGVVTHAGEMGAPKKKGSQRTGGGDSEKGRKVSRVHGPAPDVGYMKGGVLKVRKEQRGGGGGGRRR
uniref:Uncharacterized protein n=1 Tax=Odontella aurita TaxID=265563 RepID=A0A7S4N1Q6_9STRA